jgi:hypothetical protein
MDINHLWKGFLNPDASAKPRLWWHWMNGNIDEEGISKDLEWMNEIGIGGVQMFEGGLGAPLATSQRINYLSKEWQSAVKHATSTARLLEIEFTIATSAGWSALGAPWVEPSDAMKKVVWSQTLIDSDQSSHQLTQLPNCIGNFQDAPLWADDGKLKYSEDTFCLALPFFEEFVQIVPDEIVLDREFTGDISWLADGSYANSISLPRDLEGDDKMSIILNFDNLTKVGSVSIGLSGPKGFGSPYLPSSKLFASLDGQNYFELGDFPYEEYAGQAGEGPVRTFSFNVLAVQSLRIELISKPIAAATPLLAPGVRGFAYKPQGINKFYISEVAVFAGGRIHSAEYKAGFSIASDYFKESFMGPDEQPLIISKEVVDVTSFLSASGELCWQPPNGKWLIMRFGASLTGHKNGPAPDEATGLEVDKLDGDKVAKYLDRYLGQFESFLPGVISESIHSLLSDSIESGFQNWSSNFAAEFLERRGYNLTQWLPAIAGWVVDSRDITDRFLWDFRQTIVELFQESTYKVISDFAHSHGLSYYAEALEDKRPQLGDDLAMRSYADVPMGAMWTFEMGEEPNFTYIADLLGAASVSHVYGKDFTGAESMSAYGKPFSYSPKNLKHIVDLELSLGVTRFNIHTSPHQPSEVAAPGVTLAPVLGQSFSRNESWAHLAKPWISYLTKCSFLLNQGSPASDILYFIGEDAPVTGLWGNNEVDVPQGYAVDFISKSGLQNLSTGDGFINSKQGTYQAIYFGGSSQRLTNETLRRILELADSGISMAGSPPIHPASLSDDPLEFANLVESLWGGENPRIKYASSLIQAAAKYNDYLPEPDWIFRDKQGKVISSNYSHISDLRVIHRHGENYDLYFISNATNNNYELSAKLRSSGDEIFLWDPINEIMSRKLKPVAKGTTSTEVDLKFNPGQSYFLIFNRESSFSLPLELRKHSSRMLDGAWKLRIPGNNVFMPNSLLWTDSEDERVKYFTGTVIFHQSVNIEVTEGHRYFIELDEFFDIVEVFINGSSAGIIWSKSGSIEITDLLVSGNNEIEIAVSNTWWNRVLGDSHSISRFSDQSETYVAWNPLTSEAIVRPAGLGSFPKLVTYQRTT